MSDDIAIKVDNITKTYRLYDHHADRVKEAFHPFRKKYHHNFNALINVDFQVRKGESLGIIGRNGSGKSTLLQIICGILQPTAGKVLVNGRISALLELGTGFNPQFTGIQNVYINGSILGLTREEIDARFDSIVAFADIGDYINQPLKSYSSGMVVRLAFAVAISIDPDILVVDEALAVGDEAFQRKCFSKIQAFKENGITIIFVSHSGSAILELCDKAVLLDNGELLMAGKPKKVVSHYYKLIFAPNDQVLLLREKIKITQTNDIIDTNKISINKDKKNIEKEPTNASYFDPNMKSQSEVRYEPHGAQIELPHICTLDGKQVNVLCRGMQYRYRYSVQFTESVRNVRFGMLIKTLTGLGLGGALSHPTGENIKYVDKSLTIYVEFMFSCFLTPGVYFLNAGVQGFIDGKDGYLDRIIDAVMFKVLFEKEILCTATVDFKIIPKFTLIPF